MSHGFKMIINAFGIAGAVYLGCLTGYVVHRIKRNLQDGKQRKAKLEISQSH